MATVTGFETSETTGIATAVWETKFDVTHYCHEGLFLRVNRIKDSDIPLSDKRDAHILLFARVFRVDEFDHAIGTLFITATTEKDYSKAREDVPPATPHVLEEAKSAVLLHGRHWLHVLRNLQNVRNSAWNETPLVV